MTLAQAFPAVKCAAPLLGCALVTLWARTASAEDEGQLPDRYSIEAQSTTYIRLFQRSNLAGAGGTQVRTDTLAPIYEYVTVRAMDIDMPWNKDSTDVELSAWGSGTFIRVDERRDADAERLIDGDITVANVRHRIGPAYLRLGRQLVVAGTTRLNQLDGLSVGARAPFGLGFDGYAGLTVLPRWDQRPGYYHLGSAADSLLSRPDAMPEPNRTEYYMLGTRVYYMHPKFGGLGLSYHQQTDNGALGRRDVGGDLTFTPFEALSVNADGFADTDSGHLVEARARTTVSPTKEADITAEYRRAEPALLLSRQSVLSVFSTTKFDEVGGEVGYRPTSRVFVGVDGWVEVFGGDDTGMRANAKARFIPDPHKWLTLQLVVGRVSEIQNGYWTGRGSIAYHFIDPASLTFEHYTYLYDNSIRGVGTSTVESLATEVSATRELKLLFGTTIARTPYAAFDAQGLIRVSYGLDISPGVRR